MNGTVGVTWQSEASLFMGREIEDTAVMSGSDCK